MDQNISPMCPCVNSIKKKPIMNECVVNLPLTSEGDSLTKLKGLDYKELHKETVKAFERS